MRTIELNKYQPKILLMVGTPGPNDHVEGVVIGSLKDCLAIELMAQKIVGSTKFPKLRMYRNYNDETTRKDMYVTATESFESRLDAERVFLTDDPPVFYGHENEKEALQPIMEKIAERCVNPATTIVILLKK